MEKIAREDLTMQIKTALGDIFLAELTEEDNVISVKFANGQGFNLCVEEM